MAVVDVISDIWSFSAVMRYAACIEYDGTAFCGWQRQDYSPSVQENVEKALSAVANHPVEIVCAGRTDTGVHGVGQIIHFDSDATRSIRSWVMGGNSNLPKSISILWVKPVADDFHARFSATARSYRYVICNRDVRPSFLAWRTTWEHRPLDVDKMQQAADYLEGEHDFSSYRAVACQANSPVRTLHSLKVTRQNEMVFIDVQANAFLHHMIRNISGVLMTIGSGEQAPIWAQEVLHHKDRTKGGVTAHPSGLYFMSVKYPEEFAIPVTENSSLVW